MLGLLLQTAVVCGSSWFLWKLLREYVVKGTLDNLPGPPNPSFLYGQCTSSIELYCSSGLATLQGI